MQVAIVWVRPAITGTAFASALRGCTRTIVYAGMAPAGIGKVPSTSSVSRVNHEQRRALKKLASTPRGLTEHLLIAHGFSVEMLSGLVQAQLATVVTEPMREPRGVINMIERIRITDAGRRAIKDQLNAGR
jgi:hypothetical protein